MPATRTRRVSLRPGGSSSSPHHPRQRSPVPDSDPAEAAALALAAAHKNPVEAKFARPSSHNNKGRKETESLVNDTRRVLAALDPLASFYHPRYRTRTSFPSPIDTDDAVSLAAFKAQLLARSAPAARRSSLPGGTAQDTASMVDWQMYRDWPEGLTQEQEAVKAYFQRLKFIYLEQATKLTFLNDCDEDLETGKEGVVHDASSVRALEQNAAQAKAELADAKAQVRAVTAEIKEEVKLLAQPWSQLESEAAEAKQLVDQVADMELELAKIRATSGRSRRSSTGRKSASLLDKEANVSTTEEDEDALPGTADVDATVPPPVGTLTVREAESFCEAQLERMQDLAAETETVTTQTRQAEAALAQALKRAERKASEAKSHEAQLEEMRAGARDWNIEQLCTTRSAMLRLFHSALGLVDFQCPTPQELHLTYAVPSATSESGGIKNVKLVLTYTKHGGALDHYCVVDPADDSDTPMADAHVALLDAASEANQPTALVHGLWVACAPTPASA